MTTFYPTYLVSFCTANSKYWVFIFSTYPKPFINWWKIESYIQDKCYKPHKQVKFFSITGLSMTMIISDMVDFIKAASYSETTHVSTKQRLGVFASF